jgi:arylsulfotransferase ASST
MRRFAVFAFLSLVTASFASLGALREAHAGGRADALTVRVTGAALGNITSSPLSIAPTFAPATTDYVWRCLSGINSVQLTLAAVSGGTITVGGRHGSSLSIDESLIENQALIISAPDPSATRPPIQYWIRCLPHDFPELSVTRPGTPPPGWYLTGNVFPGPTGGAYAMVLDANGTPVWYRDPAGDQAINVTPLGDGTIAWDGNANPGYPAFEDYDLSSGATRWTAAPTLPTDFHEIYRMSNGELMMLSNPWKQGVDMTWAGGSASANIVDCVLQEVDANYQIVWQWRASDHVSVTESTHPNSFVAFGFVVYDPFHCNSIDTDPASGDILLSARHTDAVYRINKTSGTIAWKLGGNSISESGSQTITIAGDPQGAFHAQHDARFQPNGDISLYDNQTWDPSHAARGVEYHVDTATGTATLVWSYQSADGHNSAATGSFRRLNGGTDNVIGWGFKTGTLFTEVDGTGNVMLNVTFPNGELAYRVQKVGPMALDHDLLRATAGLPAFSFTPDSSPPITASGTAVAVPEDTGFTNAVATFDDSDPTATANGYLAAIAWGDGSSSPGTISGATGGPFSVTGSHTYASPGTDVTTVYITRVGTAAVKATATSTFTVADGPISATCATPATSIAAFNAALATFSDADLTGSASDHKATLAWGDGSSSVGTVTGPGGGPFAVSATHTYASTGRFKITTNINDVAGSSATASCSPLIYAFPPAAVAFAIGEKNTTNGTPIMFRLLPSSKLDSSNDFPARFKELWPKLPPSCGIDWATIIGSTSPAVGSSLPDYMGVIVISPVRQSGPRNADITAHLVIVRTKAGQRHDSGNGGDQGDSRGPGNLGRGTVEAQVC